MTENENRVSPEDQEIQRRNELADQARDHREHNSQVPTEDQPPSGLQTDQPVDTPAEPYSEKTYQSPESNQE